MPMYQTTFNCVSLFIGSLAYCHISTYIEIDEKCNFNP